MTISSYILRCPRRGLTLIELLVVAFILVLFVAVAAPLMKPATADRKVREAARQLNAYVAEAKAYAAQRGRPVALAFDRVFADTEAARNPNIVTRLYIAQSPPIYSGDVDTGNTATSSNVNLVTVADPINQNQTDYEAAVNGITSLPPWHQLYTQPPRINSNRARYIKLIPNNSPMLNTIIDSYVPDSMSTSQVPFRIRIGGKGTWYEGYALYQNPSPPAVPGRTYTYFCWAPYGSSLQASVPSTAQAFEIELFPQITSDSPLELPTGTVVDLQFSGYGQSDNSFNHSTVAPLLVVFSPSGDVERVLDKGTFNNQLSRIHFLVGTLDKAVDSSTSGGVNMPESNIADAANQWVSLNTRTGHVTTADNLPPTDFTTVNTAVQQARGFATGLNTKGGR